MTPVALTRQRAIEVLTATEPEIRALGVARLAPGGAAEPALRVPRECLDRLALTAVPADGVQDGADKVGHDFAAMGVVGGVLHALLQLHRPWLGASR